MRGRTVAALALAACLACGASGAALAWSGGGPRPDYAASPRRGGAAGEQDPRDRRGRAPQDSRARIAEDTALFEHANRLVQLGRCDEAVPLLERLIEDSPQLGLVPELLAGCYLKTGRARDAVSLLERCLETDPDRFSYIRDLGLAYLDLGRRDEAVAAWRRALKDDERYASHYGLVAKMQQEAGLYDEAIRTYRAGSRFRNYAEYCSNEIVRLERILGREENALREILDMMARRQGAMEADLRSAVALYRGSDDPERLVAVVDSAVAASGGKVGAYRALKTVYLIEGGKPAEVRMQLLGRDAPELHEQEINSILGYLAQARRERGDAVYDALFGALARRFLERHGASPYAPAVMLMLAESLREGAGGGAGDAAAGGKPAPGGGTGGAAARAALDEAMALADEARRHKIGHPYTERSTMLRARILLEDLHRPEEALRELDRFLPAGVAGRAIAVEELRMRILAAGGDYGEAERRLELMASDPDSNTALVGAYGLGALDFRRGRFGAAARALSELAEKHPASAWTNDALELAMEIQQAMREDMGALELYRAASVASERGEREAAIDSLAALERRYPESSLAPRALFMRARLETGRGRIDEARAAYARVAERFAEHELAPRSLEELAALAERRSRGEALARYGAIMERYPNYPFIERVRERYVTLGKSEGAEPEEGAR